MPNSMPELRPLVIRNARGDIIFHGRVADAERLAWLAWAAAQVAAPAPLAA